MLVPFSQQERFALCRLGGLICSDKHPYTNTHTSVLVMMHNMGQQRICLQSSRWACSFSLKPSPDTSLVEHVSTWQ